MLLLVKVVDFQTNIDFVEIATTGNSKDFGDLSSAKRHLMWSWIKWSWRSIMSKINVRSFQMKMKMEHPI